MDVPLAITESVANGNDVSNDESIDDMMLSEKKNRKDRRVC